MTVFSSYTYEKYNNYITFVESLKTRLNSYRNSFDAAILAYDISLPFNENTLLYNLHLNLKDLYKNSEEVLNLKNNKEFNRNLNTIIPLNKVSLSNPDVNYFSNKIEAADFYLNLLKSINIFNNRISIFVKSGTTNFTLTNQTLSINTDFTINQNVGTLENSFRSCLYDLFGVTVDSLSNTYTIIDTIYKPTIFTHKISSTAIPYVNGKIYSFTLKNQIKDHVINSNDPNVIISKDLLLFPLTDEWANSEGGLVINFLENIFLTEKYQFGISSSVSESTFGEQIGKFKIGNSGQGFDPAMSIIFKGVLKKIYDDIWGVNLDLTYIKNTQDYINIRLSPEAIWLYDFVNGPIDSISNFVALEGTVWGSLESPESFFNHNSSYIAIDQSMGILNSNPVLSYFLHESNQSNLFIDLITDTHDDSSASSVMAVYDSYKDSLNKPDFHLENTMILLKVKSHLPLIYLHYYLLKLNY